MTLNSPAGGVKQLYNYPKNYKVNDSKDVIAPGVEVICTSHQAVIPPSYHPAGDRYEWTITPEQASNWDMPDQLIARLVELGILKPEKKSEPKTKKKKSSDEEADFDYKKEAMKILKKGKPIEYVLHVFHNDYVGGEEYGRLLYLSSMCGTCNNTDGLHPGVDGESGSGKSSAMKTMVNLLPQDYVVNGTISPKALFYNSVKRGSTVYLDDVGKMPEDLAQVVKVATSKYQAGTSHYTTNKGVGLRMELQKCLNWWINGVDVGSFDIQILNRNVNVGLDVQNRAMKEEHRTDIFFHQLNDALTGRPANIVTEEVLICREMNKILLDGEQVNVAIPWMNDENGELLITWNDVNNPRNFPIFLDLMRVSASIHRYQRKNNAEGGLIADLTDFDIALQVWNRVSREQVSKLNRNDQEIIQAMVDLKADEKPVDIYDIAKKIGKSQPTVYERLHGRKLDGIKGLLDRDYRVMEVKQQEIEYDVDVKGEDQYERSTKKGSRGRQRILLKLTEKIDMLNAFSSVVTLDRDRAKKRLESILGDL